MNADVQLYRITISNKLFISHLEFVVFAFLAKSELNQRSKEIT